MESTGANNLIRQLSPHIVIWCLAKTTNSTSFNQSCVPVVTFNLYHSKQQCNWILYLYGM